MSKSKKLLSDVVRRANQFLIVITEQPVVVGPHHPTKRVLIVVLRSEWQSPEFGPLLPSMRISQTTKNFATLKAVFQVQALHKGCVVSNSPHEKCSSLRPACVQRIISVQMALFHRGVCQIDELRGDRNLWRAAQTQIPREPLERCEGVRILHPATTQVESPRESDEECAQVHARSMPIGDAPSTRCSESRGGMWLRFVENSRWKLFLLLTRISPPPQSRRPVRAGLFTWSSWVRCPPVDRLSTGPFAGQHCTV